MHRSLVAAVLAAFIATLEVAQPISAQQDPAQALRTMLGISLPADLRYRQLADGVILFDSKVAHVDIDQQTVQAFNPTSKYIKTVFPDNDYTSPYGALLMKRVEDLFGRVGEADRAALLEDKVGAGFDRSIISWDAELTKGTVALAVHYYRGRLSSHLGMELSDDYGRPEPLDPGDYEFFTIAVCSRTGVDSWTNREEELAAVAKKHNVALPNDRAGRDAAAAELVKLVLRQQ
jgi:hypothetical protein